MNAETLAFNLQTELRTLFINGKDEESIDALLALQSLEASLAVAVPYPSKNLVNE